MCDINPQFEQKARERFSNLDFTTIVEFMSHWPERATLKVELPLVKKNDETTPHEDKTEELLNVK